MPIATINPYSEQTLRLFGIEPKPYVQPNPFYAAAAGG